MGYKIIGYEKHMGAELPDGSHCPWYYRVEIHPENAEGFRTVRCLIDKKEYEANQ